MVQFHLKLVTCPGKFDQRTNIFLLEIVKNDECIQILDFCDQRRNWEFPVSFGWEFSVRISGWENFPSEDQCTGNSQSLQSGAIILRQRDTIQSALLNQGDGRKVRH